MSGVLRAIGTVASIVAMIPSPIQPIAAAVAVAASIGATLTAKRPVNERQGLQLSFKIDPDGPITLPIGRTGIGGTVVYRETMGTDNHYQTYFVDLGLGPVKSISALMDRAPVAFSGTQAVGYYNKWMWSDMQLGATPEADALGHGVTSPPWGSIPGIVPGWGPAYKLSGHAAVSWTLLFDTKARRYANGEPTPGWVVEGGYVYDPRLDSTYPGGSGSCRIDNPATWVYSETPALWGLKWRLGIWQNGKKIMGVGAPVSLIDLARIVESANIQEANGWKVGGELNSAMDRWEALKLIEQAGGAEPVPNGALMSTLQKMPRVSVGTITAADLAPGPLSIPGTRPRRERINGFRARFRSEAHGWEMVPCGLVQIADYVTADGAPRTASADYALVQNENQAAQLAAYEIYEGRELGPIELPLKPRFIAYRLGDALTVTIPELGLSGQLCVVRGRRIDPSTGIVTLRLVTETAGKHAEALGRTGNAPPVPVLTFDPPTVNAPSSDDWEVTGGTISAGDYRVPALSITGAVSNPNADGVVFDYREVGEEEWIGASIEPPEMGRKFITDVLPNTEYEVGIRYKVRGIIGDRLVLGPVTAGGSSILDLLDGAGNGMQLFVQEDEPTEGMREGDLWMQPSTKIVWIYTGEGDPGILTLGDGSPLFSGESVLTVGDGEGGWQVSPLSEGLAQALFAAADAHALADGKIRCFVTTGTTPEPVADADGDLWWITSLGVMRRWNAALASWHATADQTAQNMVSIDGLRTINISANPAGETTSTIPYSYVLKAMVGGVDRSSEATFALGTLPGGIGATIYSVPGSPLNGTLTLTRADASGDIPVSVGFPGGGVANGYMRIVRTIALPPISDGGGGGGGGGGTGTTSAYAYSLYDPYSATYDIISPTLTVESTSGGVLKTRVSGSYSPTEETGPSATVVVKIVYRQSGTSGAWIDAAAEKVGDPAHGESWGFVDTGDITITGLAASTDYDVRVLGRRQFSTRGTNWAGDALFSVRQS